jgi:hypothetical protein
MPIQRPGGGARRRELPHKVTLRGGGDDFNAWMRAIVEAIPLDAAEPTTRQRIASLVTALKRHGRRASINTVFGYLRDKGASVYRVWDIGEALREAGVEWMSGPLAVSAVPEYRWHFLGWLGTLLSRQGRTELVRSMWPFLLQSACDHYAGYPQEKRRYFIPLAATIGLSSRILQPCDPKILVLTEPQRKIAIRAWSAWKNNRQETNQFPEMIRLEMSNFRFVARSVHAQTALSVTDHFFSEWMIDVYENWDSIDKYFSVIDKSLL